MKNSNWYPIIIDLAIRLSDKKSLQSIVQINIYKMSEEYGQFINLYVNYHNNKKKYLEDLKTKDELFFSRHMYEQLKNYSPYINSLGRLLDLYKDKVELFKQEFGLSNKQMVIIYFISLELHKATKPFSSDVLYNLIKRIDSTIKKTNLVKFLNKFSRSINDYRKEAKKLNITKHTIKCERLIHKYPIVKSDDLYMILSINVLLDALSYKIFDKLNENSSESFKRDFGGEFESYIRKITQYFYSDSMYECDSLITVNSKKRAEFYIKKNNISLVIEAKVLAINENKILNGDIEELEKKFKSTINKAIRQINTCSKKLTDMYGLIVIHTHIPSLNNFFHKYKKNLLEELDGRVALISIVEYENLINKSFSDIIEEIKSLNHKSFYMIDGNGNKYLREKYNEYIISIKPIP